MQLFTPATTNSANDPWVVSPKGIKLQIPESRASELLTKGFILVDKNWRPTPLETTPLQERTVPLPKEELSRQVSAEVDLLDCEEI